MDYIPSTATASSSSAPRDSNNNNNTTTSSNSNSSVVNRNGGGAQQQQQILSMAPPTEQNIQARLMQINRLQEFLATATNGWEGGQTVKSFELPTGETVSCVLWNDLYHITGTDIVRSLVFRFHQFGRPVLNMKKFEEGVFSDLRNLKPGNDACLEDPKSEFLDLLYKNNCIRTQKKQKVFYWFSVPHDRLFLDALERDLKREKIGIEPTSVAVAEPATTLSSSTQRNHYHEFFDQLRKSMALSTAAAVHALDEASSSDFISPTAVTVVQRPSPPQQRQIRHVASFTSLKKIK